MTGMRERECVRIHILQTQRYKRWVRLSLKHVFFISIPLDERRSLVRSCLDTWVHFIFLFFFFISFYFFPNALPHLSLGFYNKLVSNIIVTHLLLMRNFSFVFLYKYIINQITSLIKIQFCFLFYLFVTLFAAYETDIQKVIERTEIYYQCN